MHGKLNGIAEQSGEASAGRIEKKYAALILKMTPSPIHHGALAVARTLGRLGVPVYGVVEDAYVPLASSRYLKRAFVWDPCPRNPASFVQAMTSVGEAIAQPTVVISMDDLSAVFVAQNAGKLRPWFIVPRVAADIPRKLANKACLVNICCKMGIPFPRSIVPHCVDEIKSFVEKTGFPVVAKAVDQWLPLPDTHSTRMLRTEEDLCCFLEGYEFGNGPRLMIQEHIPGDDWICHGYYNSKKMLAVTFTGKKLRGYPPEAGSTALGISVENELLRHESERLLKSVGYSGIVDMDWRRDERDGSYKLLDCNPRVGQNFRMFKNSVGLDVVRAQYLDLSGERIDTIPNSVRHLFTVESYHFLAMLRRLPRGPSHEDTRTYFPHHGREWAWWSADDPSPFLMMIARVFLQLAKRTFVPYA
jgi:D-aspartate ligase